MSTDFQDRITRLNAKHGVQPPETPLPPSAGAGPENEPERPRKEPAKGAIVKYILIGVCILVVMPLGAAMGTIYLAQ